MSHMPYMLVDGEVATLSLNRPPANLLNIDVLEELNEAVLSLRAQKAIEVLLVRSSPAVFSEGMDLGEHVAKRVQRLMHVYMRLFESMRMMDAIQVAVVQGKRPGDEVTIETVDALKPALLRAPDHPDFLYLLMPVRVS